MATSYLSTSQKRTISSLFDNIHATFARTAYLFKIGERVSIATNSGYNAFYQSQSANTEFSEVSMEIMARITYLKADEEFFSFKDGSAASGSQNKVALPAGSAKVKVNEAAHLFMKDAKRFEIDGQRFSIVSNARPIAMFGPDYSPYYEYMLIPTDEQ